MALETTTNIIQHVADGVQRVFPYDFRIDRLEDVNVLLNGFLVPQTQYLVTGLGEDNGGAVDVRGFIPPDTAILSILRLVDATQRTVYPDYGPFPAKSHELALDKLTMLHQQQEGDIRNTIRVPVTDPPDVGKILPEAPIRANRFLYFDEDGNATVRDGTGADNPGVQRIFIGPFSQRMLAISDILSPQFPVLSVNNVNGDGGLMQLTSISDVPPRPSGGIPTEVILATPLLRDSVQSLEVIADSINMLVIDDADPNNPLIGVNRINQFLGLMEIDAVGGIPTVVIDATPLIASALQSLGVVADSDTMLAIDNTDPNNPLVGVINIDQANGLMKLTTLGGIPNSITAATPIIRDAVQSVVIALDSLDMLVADNGDTNIPVIGVNNINGEAGLMQLVTEGDYPQFPNLPGGGIPIEVLANTPFLLFAVFIDDGTLQPGTDSGEMLTSYRQSNPSDPFGFVDIIGVNTPNQADHLLQLDEFGQIPSDLLQFQGLRNRGIFRGDDLCDKPGDGVGDCTAPDTRNPSERFPSLDYPPGTDPGTQPNQSWRAGDFFALTFLDPEVDGTMNLFTELGQALPSIVTVESTDGIIFLPQVVDPDPPNDILTQHGWYLQKGRFNLTTADLVALNTAGYGFITPLPSDNVQEAFNFLDTALGAFRADQVRFDTSGGTLIIDPASEDVQQALLDLDVIALSKATGGVVAGALSVIYGSLPEINVQYVDGTSARSSYNLRDSGGVLRGRVSFENTVGTVSVERFTAGGVLQTRLELLSDGNVTVNASAPSGSEHLTRRDYVNAEDAVIAAAAAAALAAAVAAQGTADQAITNAAAAQGTANTALLDAATADGKAVAAQGTADQALFDAGIAQDSADVAIGDAAAAQSTANDAADSAALRILRSGDTMAGQLKSAVQPVNVDDLTRKDYVDSRTIEADFPAGTLMLFQQAAAPTGWTTQATHNDKALRVVSSAPGSGGTVLFSTVFGRVATDPHTLVIGEMPAHTHTTSRESGPGVGAPANNDANPGAEATSSTGGGGPHSHPMDIRVQYVDVIIASRNPL